MFQILATFKSRSTLAFQPSLSRRHSSVRPWEPGYVPEPLGDTAAAWYWARRDTLNS